MYKNNFKHEQTGNPQYYNGTLQKIRNNNFFKLTPYLLSAVIGFSAAYNFLKTNFSGADAAELQKNLNENKPIECVLSEEHQPVPYVLLGSQVVGMQTITPLTKEDKGNIASLENSFYGDEFNKYVSPLKKKASSIEDEIVISKIVISNQGEIFKIKTGKIDSTEYLVGIKKIGEISEHNRKMSDSERKATLIEILNSYQNDSESDTTSTTVDPCVGVDCTDYGVTMTDTICLLGCEFLMTVITEGYCKDGICRWKQVDAYTTYIGPCDTTSTTSDNGTTLKNDAK